MGSFLITSTAHGPAPCVLADQFQIYLSQIVSQEGKRESCAEELAAVYSQLQMNVERLGNLVVSFLKINFYVAQDHLLNACMPELIRSLGIEAENVCVIKALALPRGAGIAAAAVIALER